MGLLSVFFGEESHVHPVAYCCGILLLLPGLAQQGKLGRAAGVGFLGGSVGWLNTPFPATPSALPVGDIVTVGDIAEPCHP